MIKKAKHYFNHSYDIEYYADTFVETIAFMFVLVLYALFWCVASVFLFVTCPLWIIPYCIYKSRKGRCKK